MEIYALGYTTCTGTYMPDFHGTSLEYVIDQIVEEAREHIADHLSTIETYTTEYHRLKAVTDKKNPEYRRNIEMFERIISERKRSVAAYEEFIEMASTYDADCLEYHPQYKSDEYDIITINVRNY